MGDDLGLPDNAAEQGGLTGWHRSLLASKSESMSVNCPGNHRS